MQDKKYPTEYLGDGVYALCDGYGIWLHANDPEVPDHKIYLAPMVLDALNNFNKWLMSARTDNVEG